MDFLTVVFIDSLAAIGTLTLVCLGLFIVFGLMRVINFAHAEFVMVGAVVTAQTVQAGLPFWLAALVAGPLAAGLVALVVEWVVIRHLYGRVMQTLLATWGVSLVLIGLVTMAVGTTAGSISTPLGSFMIGQYQLGGYRLVLIVAAVLLVIGIWYVLYRTGAGLVVRAAMQRPEMVAALGYDPKVIYRYTFVCSGLLAGLAGGLIAPTTGIVPTMGATLIADAFITVVASGASGLIGNLVATAAILSASDYMVSLVSNPVLGTAAMLFVAVVLIRLRPNGIFERNGTMRLDSTSEEVEAILALRPSDRRTQVPTTVLVSLAILGIGGVASFVLDPYALLQLTAPVVMALFALSLAFCWGFGGIASFGHSLFFGLGAYAFAIAGLNFGTAWGAMAMAVIVTAAAGTALALVLFLRLLSPLHVGVITLCATLIGYNFLSSTADPFYRVFGVLLNGFNGIGSFPTLTFDPVRLFQIAVAMVASSYLVLGLVVASRFGQVSVAVRDNPFRAALLGMDVRLVMGLGFAISAAFAGLAGALYANWSNLATPDLTSLAIAAGVVIWTVVGGLGTLIGPLIAAIALEYLRLFLGRLEFVDAGLATGVIMILFVLLLPQGVVPSLMAFARRGQSVFRASKEAT